MIKSTLLDANNGGSSFQPVAVTQCHDYSLHSNPYRLLILSSIWQLQLKTASEQAKMEANVPGHRQTSVNLVEVPN